MWGKAKKKMPMPVTLNDCLLLYQMGYSVIVHDGKVKAIIREQKKRRFLKPFKQST